MNHRDEKRPHNSTPIWHNILRHPVQKNFIFVMSPYLLSAFTTLLIGLLFYPIQSIIGYQTVGLILLFAVTLLPLKVSTGPALLAAATSALIWNFFFIPPAFTFAIGHPHDILMFFAYFIIAAVTGILTSRIRSREMTVRLREVRTLALYSLTQGLSAATSLDEVVRAGVENFKKFMNVETILCLSENDGDMLARPHPFSNFQTDEKEFNIIGWVYWNEKRCGRFTDIHPDASATYYPISGPRYPLGVLGVRLPNNESMTPDQESLTENFIQQIASALEREQLNELSRKTFLIEASERLYKNLFDSLSHEFKTPISTILGSCEQLSVLGLSIRSTDQSFVEEIKMAAERLDRLVGNLLDMTRLESGLLKPKMDWCDVSDLIGTTVRKLEAELKTHAITLHIEENMPLVRLDTGLTEQVLANLLHNASQYTQEDSKIDIAARMENRRCVITVSDNGPGIPVEDKDKIFQKFFRASGEKTGGTGLGLSIARGFIEAQGGTIVFRNRNEGGAEFLITVPVKEDVNVWSSL